MAMRTDAQIIELENKYWQALKERDVDTALDLTDDTCIVTGPQGVRAVSHDDYRSMWGDGDWRVKDFEIKDTEILMLNRSTAVLGYTVREQMTVDGEEITIEAADTSTWIKREGGWKCAMHSESILGDSFGRDRN